MREQRMNNYVETSQRKHWWPNFVLCSRIFVSGLRKPTNTGRNFYVIHNVHTVKIYTSTNKCS